MLGALAAVLLVAATAAAAPPARSKEAIEERRQAVAPEVIAIGLRIRREIERRDVAALLARVPAEGLRCGERLVPRERVARDLRNERSWLHGVLFGGAGYRPPPGTAPSLAALFRSSREIAVALSFEPDPRAGPEGRPCLEYRSREAGTPVAPLCFEKRGERWWLVESLYPCA